MIQCKCNNCGYEIKTYDKFAGKRVRCPKCKEPLQLPHGEGGTSPKETAIIKFRCPNCDQKIGLPTKYAGKVVRCAKCEHRLRVPQAPGAAAQPKPQDDLAALRVGQEQPAADEGGIPGLGDMSDLLQLEASAPAVEEPLRLSPVGESGDEGESGDYASQFPTRPSFKTDGGEERKKNKLVVPIVIASVCIVVLVIGYVAVKSIIGSLDIAKSQAGTNSDEAQQFTEDYITLLADGDIDAAIEKLSPEVKATTGKEQIGRLAKLVGENEIVELEVRATHFEESFRGNLFYFWYGLTYEESAQSVIVCVREGDTGFTVDGIAAQEPFGEAVVIGQRSYEELAGTVVVSAAKSIAAFLARIACVLIVVLLVIGLIQTIAMWVIFEKANQPGWAAIVPFYNMWVLAEVGDKPGWMGLAMCFCNFIPVPVVGFILYLVLWITISVGVAKSFGRSVLFGIGLSLLPFIFYPILAFSRD
ncbi:MAG: DUF5684 domain-containing protein [Planctomycetota bacterium]|jgi:hypothetical protein